MKKILIIFLFLISCSSMKQKISKNNIRTDELVEKLFQENGNAFYIKSSYSTFSYVWSYTLDEIKIYNLVNGKIEKKLEFEEVNNYLAKVPQKPIFEADNCLQLDGEIIGYKLNHKNKIYKNDFPVELNCFLSVSYKSVFLRNLVLDIKKYDIRW